MKRMVGKQELAKLMNYANSTITKYIKSGILKFDANDKIDFDEAVEAIEKNVNRRAKKNMSIPQPTDKKDNQISSNDLDLFGMTLEELKREVSANIVNQNDAKLMLLKMDIINKRMKNDEVEGQFIQKENVEIFTFELGATIKNQFETIEENLIESLRNIEDDLLKRTIIRRELERARIEISFEMAENNFKKIQDEIDEMNNEEEEEEKEDD